METQDMCTSYDGEACRQVVASSQYDGEACHQVVASRQLLYLCSAPPLTWVLPDQTTPIVYTALPPTGRLLAVTTVGLAMPRACI